MPTFQKVRLPVPTAATNLKIKTNLRYCDWNENQPSVDGSKANSRRALDIDQYIECNICGMKKSMSKMLENL
jgi:hypothetical protein